MKAFMEEYGRILVSALVVLVLVASAKGLGSNIQGGIQAAVNGFTDKANEVTAKIETNGSGEVGSEEETLAPGLYAEDGTMTYSWEELTKTKLVDRAYGFDEYDNLLYEKVTILNVDENGVLSSPDDVTERITYFYISGELILPNNVKSISEYTFSNNKNLISITIPSTIETIGDNAFYSTGLKDIYYDGTKDEWNNLIPVVWKSGLDSGLYDITVHCTDEDIVISVCE